MARTVRTRNGRTWVVRRRWVPRLGAETAWGRFHRRYRQVVRRTGDAADVDPGCLDVFGEGLLAAVAIIVGLLLLLFVVVPLLVAVVDIVIVLLLALLGLAGRILLRRPWVVEACADDGARLEWRVVGWRASGEQVDRAADRLAAGVTPPDATRHFPPGA